MQQHRPIVLFRMTLKLLALSVLCFVFVACDDQSTIDERMIGYWSEPIESAEGDSIGTFYVFHEDGTLAVRTFSSGSAIPEGGAWWVNREGELCMTVGEDGDEECAAFEFTDERTVTLTDDASGTVTTLRRQQIFPIVPMPRDETDS